MSDLLSLLPIVVAGIIGYFAGQVVNYRRAKFAGREWVVPYVEKTSRNFTIVVLALSLLTASTVVISAVNQSKQDRCNQEFKRVIAANSGITAETAATQDDLWLALRGVLSGEPDTTPAGATAEIDKYLAIRDVAKSERREYPDPQCF